MAASSKLMIGEAERRFPVRIRVAVPAHGFGSRLDVASGRKEPWQTLKVPEPGAEFIGALALSADGKACAFTFQHDLANLYLVRGLK